MNRLTRHLPQLSPRAFAAALLLWIVAAGWADAELTSADWPAFRGDGRNLTESTLPTDWSVESGKNIAWKAELPGRGVSSPIVVAGRVIVTCSGGPEERELTVIAFDAETGKQRWRRDFEAKGNVTINELTAVAANTPATDGERIFALFSSNDLFALDLDGNDLWSKNLTADHEGLGNDFGMASSPVCVDDAVVVQCNGETAGFVAAYDARDGEVRWQQSRPNQASWTSPYVVEELVDGSRRPGVIVQSPKAIEALESDTGNSLWRVELECDAIASSTYAGTRFYVPAKWLVGIDPTVVDPQDPLVWEGKRLKPTSASPVVRDGKIFAINRGGVFNCFDLAKDELAWTERLGASVWATPLSTPTHLYCFNAKGTAFVLDLKGEIVAEIEMDDEILASPAVSGNAMFVRSHHRLWKIAE